MTKLDEIEADWKRGELHSWKYEEAIDLLIRAVRQLGATVNMYLEIQESEGNLRTLPYQVDPDVLELLE